MSKLRTIARVALGGLAVAEGASALHRWRARREVYEQAARRAAMLHRPLIVVGDPDAGAHTRLIRAFHRRVRGRQPAQAEHHREQEIIIRSYLVPTLGERALDTITEADVQRLKAAFADQAPASVNNMLTPLSTVLKAAIEWKVIAAMPEILKLKADGAALRLRRGWALRPARGGSARAAGRRPQQLSGEVKLLEGRAELKSE